jgi:hypothetical protein
LEPVTTTVYAITTVTRTQSVLAIGGQIQRYVVTMDNGNGMAYVVTTEVVSASSLVPLATETSMDCPTLTVTVNSGPTDVKLIKIENKFPSAKEEQQKAFNALLKKGRFADSHDAKVIDLENFHMEGN